MKYNIPNPIRKSFLVSFFLLILIFGLSLWSLNRLIKKADWVEHTNVVLLKLENILSLLKDAETGQRGYLLTEDEDFLEPYIGSYYKTLQRYKEIKNLTIDNVKQQQKLDTLIALVNKRFNLLNRTIELEKNGQAAPARVIVASKEGKMVMDRIRKLIQRMQAEELSLKEIRYDQVRTSSYITPVTIVSLALMALIISISSYHKTKKEMELSVQLNEQLQSANTALTTSQNNLNNLNLELEQKVIERTTHLTVAQEELAKVNQELTYKNQQLQRINADLDTFIYTASHDLKAPIANIEGLTLALQDSSCYQEEEPKHLIGLLLNACTTLNEVISDMAQVNNIERDQDSKTEVLDIQKVVEEVKDSISILFEETKAELTYDLQEAKDLIFSKSHFRSLLYNLMHNGIRFRAPDRHPHLHISTRKLPQFTVLSVQDNGIGVNPEKKEEIFKLFKKLHNQADGTGVGLFIVKRIMDNANGKIEVFSKMGEGTTFNLFFPNSFQETEL